MLEGVFSRNNIRHIYLYGYGQNETIRLNNRVFHTRHNSADSVFTSNLVCIKAPIEVFVYKIQVNPIHSILDHGNYYDFMVKFF